MYPYGKYEVTMKQSADLSALADVATWAPGLAPHRICGVALLNRNAAAAAGELRLDIRPTFGSDTNRGDGDGGILAIPSTLAGGKVLYKVISGVVVTPGQEVVAQVTDVTGAGDLGDIVLEVERSYEAPGNNSAMVAAA